jgi:murein DD-endopeptidase MepM/ murein hydrolase activator NlpD
MKSKLLKIVIAVFFLLIAAAPAAASLQDDLARYRAEQARLQGLIDAAHKQANTLSGQVSILDNQIKLTQIQVSSLETELAIKQGELDALTNDIGGVTVRIGNIETDLNRVAGIAAKRFRTTEAIRNSVPMGALLVSSDFQTVADNLTYLEYIQHQDQKLFDEMRNLKDSLGVEKRTLVDKQTEVQKVKDDIQVKYDEVAAAKAKLDSQRADKANLLAITKNTEANYQKLLQQVQGEIQAIQVALSGGGIKIGPVAAGAKIANQGNTGCSTGTHVHFGYYLNGATYDPKPKLDSGYFRWPVISPRVTQWYGANYSWYMQFFGMPGHNGIDMQTGNWPNGGYGSPIYASKAGTAYLSVESSPCSLTGTRGKGIVIDHGLGVKTIYWHIQ